MKNLYNPEVLSTMTDETFFCNGLAFTFDDFGEVVDVNTSHSYPTMRQFFLAKGDTHARPSKAISEDGTPFPEVYESYVIKYNGWDDEYDEEVEPEPVKSNVDVVNEIIDNLLNGNTTITEAIDIAFNEVKSRCNVPENLLTKIDTMVKMSKIFG